MNTHSIADSVTFTVSEPEEFYLSNGEGPFAAVLTELNGEYAIMKNVESLSWNDSVVRFLVATARHEAASLSDFVAGKTIAVNLIPITGEPGMELSSDAILERAGAMRGRHLIGSLKRGG